MKNIFSHLILFIFFSFSLGAQTIYELKGKIIDAKTNRPLERVNIFNQTSVTGSYSELDGTFQINIEGFPTTIIFSYVGYENVLLNIEEPPTKPITIKLQSSSIGLTEIEITDQPKVDKLTQNTHTIKDFILEENRVLVLASPGVFSGNKLILKDWDGKIIDELKLKKAKGKILHRSCLGNIHLIGKRYGYEVSLIGDKIQLISKYEIHQFEKLIEPCVAANEELLYWKKYEIRDQLLTYIIISKAKKDIVSEISLIDDLNLFRSKDDFVLAEEIGMNPSDIEKQSWNQLMYKPLFSPLHIFRETLCLFDHTNGYLEFLTPEGKTLRHIPITYHQNRKWEKRILFDKKNNKAYTVYKANKGKAIYKINLEDGSTSASIFFDAEFVDKMEIHDGQLFYLESENSKKGRNRILHRIKL